MFRFLKLFPLIVLFLSLCGCPSFKEESSQTPDAPVVEPAAPPVPLMPSASEQDLEKLGPKNQIPELDWLQSKAAFGVVLNPKRLLESKVATDGKDILSMMFVNFSRIPVELEKVEFFAANGVPRTATIPPQPGSSQKPQTVPFSFLTYCVKFTEPVSRQEMLDRFVPPGQGFPAPKARSVSGKDVYDLPAGAPLETHAVVFPNEHTMLYILADEATLADVLDGKSPSGPLAERMSRAKLDASDLAFFLTGEGGPVVPPEMVASVAAGFNISESLGKTLFGNFRALQLNLNVASAENEDLVKIDFETTTPEGAKEVGKRLLEQVTFLRTEAPATDPGAPSADGLLGLLPQSADTSVLDALAIDPHDSTVTIHLKRFASFDTLAGQFFQEQRNMIAAEAANEQLQAMLQQVFQRLLAIRQYMFLYHNEKGQFPPAAIVDAEGKPLLSWRIAILPYMGKNEKDLYAQFKLDEPWDSPNNKPLIARMPMIFADPRGVYDPTRTTIQLFNSPGTPFANPALKMTDLPGPQGTVMLVAVMPDNSTEWTRPDNLSLDQTPEAFAQLFGPIVPIVTFGGQPAPMNWTTNPEMLLFFEKLVKGLPLVPDASQAPAQGQALAPVPEAASAAPATPTPEPAPAPAPQEANP